MIITNNGKNSGLFKLNKFSYDFLDESNSLFDAAKYTYESEGTFPTKLGTGKFTDLIHGVDVALTEFQIAHEAYMLKSASKSYIRNVFKRKIDRASIYLLRIKRFNDYSNIFRIKRVVNARGDWYE